MTKKLAKNRDGVGAAMKSVQPRAREARKSLNTGARSLGGLTLVSGIALVLCSFANLQSVSVG